ncbi:hypothetical protein D2Q93_14750 [Alicyclobacillaceae bacterium I2511]|nr:hypothetical protein D2Q93_14750 [Alicyclobacillaceae bacterium I2511]
MSGVTLLPDVINNLQKEENELEKEKAPKRTQVEILIQLFDSINVKAFHTEDKEYYAKIHIQDHEEILRIGGKEFKLLLQNKFYHQEGKTATKDALNRVIEVLEGKALYEGTEEPVFTRIAINKKQIILDLGTSDWKVIVIDEEGWIITSQSPVNFIRSRSMLSLPIPSFSGNVEKLRNYIAVPDDESWVLLVAWLLQSFNPNGPYWILVLQGEQGTGKSTIARILRSLIDPAKAELRTIPRDERDLIVYAKNSWVLAFDNLSGTPTWLSDALCRISTGGGFGARALYTDGEESIFWGKRSIILTGIDEVVSRHDLLDRSLIVNLSPMSERKTEVELMAEFENQKPVILGGILDAISSALRNRGNMDHINLPRMADAAAFVIAAEEGLGWAEGTFLASYNKAHQQDIESAIEGDMVASTLLDLLKEKGIFRGTMAELLDDLSDRVGDKTKNSRRWPQTPKKLSNRLKRAAPHLREIGVIEDKEKTKGKKEIIFELVQSPETEIESGEL